MPTFELDLSCRIAQTYFNVKAADSVDMNIADKNTFKLKINADIKPTDKVGLILGPSGSGKTQLATRIYEDIAPYKIKSQESILDQFPHSVTYEDRIELLNGVGLTSVPCWVRPAFTLSNGQKYRAEVALSIANKSDPLVFDEWTSVVNREVAKVMSERIGKFIRQRERNAIFISCHYDITDWLQPDWVIDCKEQTFYRPTSFKKKALNLPYESAVKNLGTILSSFTI